MPSVDVGGVSLFYEEAGSGEPVVFVHGIPTDYRAWRSQMGPFSSRFRSFSLSRRYARPNKRQGDLTDSSVSNNGADLKGFIENLGIAPVNLVGHSYGGFVAAVLAADHQDLVRSLVLVEPAVPTMLIADPGSTGQMLSLLIRSPSVAASARRFQSRSLAPSLKALDSGEMERAVQLNVEGLQERTGALAQLPEEVRSMMLENAHTVGELRTRFPRFTKSEAGRISCRALILNGESSPLWLRRIGVLLGRSIPGAHASTIAGARHFPHVEKPAEFNSKVLEFLGALPGRR